MRTAVREMQTVIHGLANEHMGETPSARRNLNKTVGLYFVVHNLRTDGLVAWRDQLKLLRERCAAGGGDEEMVEYLDQLVARYDHRIGRCDMVLQGASLAYQMVRIPQEVMFVAGDGARGLTRRRRRKRRSSRARIPRLPLAMARR